MRIPYDVPVTAGREFVALVPDVAAAILLVLEAGWVRASSFPDVHARAGEVQITERLRDGMRHALKEGDFPWSKTLIIAPGTESRSRTDVLVPDGRTDISVYVIEIFFQLAEHDPHAIIECKRIAGKNAHLCREYVVEGIDRFQTGKYGENHAVGFMAGYLLSDDAAAAAVGINAYLSGQARDAEHLGPSNVLDKSWTWCSQHPRATPAPAIELHHAFFGLPSPAS